VFSQVLLKAGPASSTASPKGEDGTTSRSISKKAKSVVLPQSALDAQTSMKALLRRLTGFFAFALLVLAALVIVSTVLVVIGMNAEVDDSRISEHEFLPHVSRKPTVVCFAVNLSGRQRMLSERIVGTSAVVLLDLKVNGLVNGSSFAKKYQAPVNKLTASLSDWQVARYALVNGNASLGISHPDTRQSGLPNGSRIGVFTVVRRCSAGRIRGDPAAV
jgi:hypothetical protein